GGWHGGGRRYYYPSIYADPYWGWGYGWGWGFGPYGFYGYNGGYYGGPRNGYGNNSDWAVVDTDVSPEEARVFLDGRYIGLADDFDGHPDYLYLRPGNYSLEFRLEGYEPATVSVNAKPGAKVSLNNKLKKIPGAKQYGSYDTPQPEGGLQRYFGKRTDGTDEALDRSRHDPNQGRYRDGDGDRSNRDPNEVEATPDEVRRPPAPARGGSDLREDEWRQSRPRHGARLLLVIRPADAAVYLDDRFIGTADEVGGPDQAVPLSAGKHSVTVSRPGFKDKTVEVEALAGEVKRVDVTLEK
ncbi:MAG TPA: PEGA domain-containing protein, partial [Thermoanaerobaculia bacterium]|nr:PEGA domain-containing protein [Thermoanaerobaculia bacterium]